MKKPNPELTDADNPEWTEADFAHARPAREVHPDLAAHSARRKRGRQKAPTKVAVSIRVDREILAKYKATGHGWQTRINEALRKEAP